MKFLITLLTFNFLCVWCFGFEDCEDDDGLVCLLEETAAFLETTRASIPYESGQGISFVSDSGVDIPVIVTSEKFAFQNNSGDCERRLVVRLVSTDEFQALDIMGHLRGDSLAYRYLLKRGGEGETDIIDVGISPGPGDRGSFLIRQDRQRVVADTTLAGGQYQDVLVSDFPFSGAFSAVYYTQEEGFVQFDLPTGPRIFLVE